MWDSKKHSNTLRVQSAGFLNVYTDLKPLYINKEATDTTCLRSICLPYGCYSNNDYFPKQDRSFYWRKCALCAVGIEFLNSQGLTMLVCSELMENTIKTNKNRFLKVGQRTSLRNANAGLWRSNGCVPLNPRTSRDTVNLTWGKRIPEERVTSQPRKKLPTI